MNIFISSIISGMESFREAARAAVEQLGHTAIMAEDFGALPTSPQVACLDGLRKSALTVLIIGQQYGAKQRSGLSATHEEFREAKDRRPILAFLKDGIDCDADQAAFVKEVGTWEAGLFRENFSSPDQLKALITRRVHQWEVSTASSPIDEAEMLSRALAALDRMESERSYKNFLAVSIAAGPRQTLLRPASLESPQFKKDIQRAALFGQSSIFSPEQKTLASVREHALVLSQGQDHGAFTLDGEGSLSFKLPIASEEQSFGGMIVIEEDVKAAMLQALAFSIEIWDTVDSTQRLSHGALACKLLSRNSGTWRTRAEQASSPNSYTMNMSDDSSQPVHLNPSVRSRSAIAYQRDEIADDLVTLLKRQMTTRRW